LITSFRALKNRNYRRYFIGQFVSMSGNWMQLMVQSWLVYRLTGSAAWLGAITFASQFSSFLTAPWAGILADQFDRRRILLATECMGLLQSLALAALIFSGSVEAWQIAALSMLLGAVNAFEINTRHAFAMDVVGKENLSSAIALNAAVINSSRVVGPAIGGILIPWIGEGGCFLLNSASYLGVIAGLLAMKLPRKPRPTDFQFEIFRRISATGRYIWRNREIRNLMTIVTFVSFVVLPYSVVLPVFARDILRGDAKVLAWLTGMAGAGAVTGAVLLGGAAVEPRKVRKRVVIYTVFSGLCLIALALSTHPWISYLATFGIGLFTMSVFPQINSAIQIVVEDSIRAQVLSLYSMTFFGAMPVGSLLVGGLADRLGVSAVTSGCGALSVVFAATVYCFSRNESVGSRA
jgi:MFS family permease